MGSIITHFGELSVLQKCEYKDTNVDRKENDKSERKTNEGVKGSDSRGREHRRSRPGGSAKIQKGEIR